MAKRTRYPARSARRPGSNPLRSSGSGSGGASRSSDAARRAADEARGDAASPQPNVLRGPAPVPNRAPAPPPARPRPGSVEPNEEIGDDMPARSSGHLTDAELQRAEELEAESTAKERAAAAEAMRRREREAAAEEAARVRGDVNAPLRVRMAHEYAYVARDVRRIALTAGLMAVLMTIIYVAVNASGLIAG